MLPGFGLSHKRLLQSPKPSGSRASLAVGILIAQQNRRNVRWHPRGSMTIQELGSIGELIAAIATVATLLYLATQIRQNNRNLRESTSASMNQGWASINSRLSSDEQFAEIFMRGREDLESLNPVEVERFRAFVQDILNMAVYEDGLKASPYAQSLHFDSFEVVGSLYQSCPGIRAVVDSLEAATPRDLVQRLRQTTTPTYAFIKKESPSDEKLV